MEKLEVLKLADGDQSDERVQWCNDNLITNFGAAPKCYIDDNNKLIIDGNIIICNEFEELPIKIDKVVGSVCLDNIFEKREGKFKSLKNMPDYISGAFKISMNPNITSLVGGPTYVGGSYWCNGCGLTSLDGLATDIGGSLLAFYNRISNIEYLSKCSINDSIELNNNPIVEDQKYYTILEKVIKK